MSWRPVAHTARSCRCNGIPTRATATRVPAASSAVTASELSTAGPLPAATACLMAVARHADSVIMTLLLESPVALPARTRYAPNLFAAVMGTGIVATAAATLPVHVPGLVPVARLVWVAAAALLVALVAAGVRHRRTMSAGTDDPQVAPFLGAPPMAMMTVGGGTLLLGRDWIGEPAAVAVAATLWVAGTVLGLATAVGVPYLMMTRHRIGADAAFGGWLMPVVPPMVSAANGALLIPYLPAGELRLALLLACWAMVGAGLIAALLVTGQVWSRLLHHGAGPARTVPILWIVLGPLGQAITAVHLLGGAADGVLQEPYAAGARVAALLFGVLLLGFALVWLALAAALTARTAAPACRSRRRGGASRSRSAPWSPARAGSPGASGRCCSPPWPSCSTRSWSPRGRPCPPGRCGTAWRRVGDGDLSALRLRSGGRPPVAF